MIDLREHLQRILGEAYTVERELPAGGMGRVFLAQEHRMGRQVIVKVLPPDAALDVNAERFRREIQLAGSLQHPHIVPVHAAGHDHALFYYTMPFVEGESLRARLEREGELPVPDVARILRDVVDAIAYAHSRGVVHRDIKPDNILLSGRHALVADFGVAKALTASVHSPTITSKGLAIGTPAYMAPEQAAADPQTDHRADIYAAGILAYEMLTGQPPFTAATPQQVLAAQVNEVPVGVAARRGGLPAGLADLVMRCLEKRPADRWQRADDMLPFLEGIGTPSGGTAPRRGVRPRRRRLFWLGAPALAALVAIPLALHRGSRSSLDPNLVVVAPFDVLGSNLALWREGLVDLLSRDLDGAGPLRTVPPTTVVRGWQGLADPASAGDLARRTGARVAVFGQLVATGHDSVRLHVSLLDAHSRTVLGEIELRDRDADIDQIVDSLTIAILRQLGQANAIQVLHLASVGTHSLPALKAFLQGEQYFRRASWDSGLVAYREAIAADSMFALPWRRIGLVVGWSQSAGDSASVQALRRASSLNHGLAPRDSFLVLSDSLSAALFAPSPHTPIATLTRRLFTTVQAGLARYPEDAELWYALGDARYHFGGTPQISAESSLAAFRRAIAFDSTFAPSFIHPVELALRSQDAVEARTYIRDYLALHTADRHAAAFALLEGLLQPDTRAATLARMRGDTVPIANLLIVMANIGGFLDSAETTVAVAQTLKLRAARDSLPWSAPAQLHFYDFVIASALASRGHLRAAYAAIDSAPDALLAELASFPGIVPGSVARARMDRAGQQRSGHVALRWWAANGDSVALRRYIQWAESLARAAPAESIAYRRQLLERDRAYLDLARHDSASAASRLSGLPDTSVMWESDLLIKSELSLARGRAGDAIEPLTLGYVGQPPPYNIPTITAILRQLALGQAQDKVGNSAAAAAAYRLVLRAWRHPDPDLLPYLYEAGNGLQRAAVPSTQGR